MKSISSKKLSVLFIVAIFVATCIFGFSAIKVSTAEASADYQASEIHYGSDLNYSEDGSSYVETEEINYSTKTVTSYVINSSFPCYYNTNPELTNACANVAGANILGYFDRYYADLIPNYTPGIQRATGYSYYSMTLNQSYKQNVIDTLYVLMSTNNPIAGTSQTQYKNGLASYVASKNLSITYNGVMSNSVFSLSMAHTQFAAGNPISLFLSGYNFTSIYDNGSKATLTKVIYGGNHIVIAYGYQQVNYYNSNGNLIKSDLYLSISTGILSSPRFYILNNNGSLNDAEAAHIC